MGMKLKKAFEKHVGRVDDESYVEVAKAFLDEVEANDEYIVAVDSSDPNNKVILLMELGDGQVGLPVLSDTSYVKDFPGGEYARIDACDLMQFFEANEFITGIIINPYSEFHCYLPRHETFEYLRQNNIDFNG